MRVDHVFEDFGNALAAKILRADGDNSTETFPLPRNFECLKHLVDSYET
jgi:hypothetical protein